VDVAVAVIVAVIVAVASGIAAKVKIGGIVSVGVMTIVGELVGVSVWGVGHTIGPESSSSSSSSSGVGGLIAS
jgi:hypothetical protein